MADIVKQGIEKANEDLVKENENKLMQEVSNNLQYRNSPLLSSSKCGFTG